MKLSIFQISTIVSSVTIATASVPVQAIPTSSNQSVLAQQHLAQVETNTIVDIASESEDFETLTAALSAADLVDTLATDGPFTVFAPTDSAFAELPDGALDYLLEPENRDLLTEILLYHVVPDTVMSSDLTTGGVDTLNGGIAVAVTDDGVVINNASVIQPDIEADNGVIHVINRVLIPSDVQTELAAALAAPSAEPVRALW